MNKCKICEMEFDKQNGLTYHIKQIHKLTIKDYYDMYLKREDEDKCRVCGNPTKFYKLKFGYRKTCSSECCKIYSVAEWRKSMNEKYNGKYYSSTEEYREKRKADCMLKYNCEYYWQAEEIKEKRSTTMIERYGVEHTMQSDEFKTIAKEHREYTNKERYGVKHNWSSKELRETGQYATCLDRYGYKHPSQAEEIKQKMRETSLDKYGTSNPMQSPKVYKHSLCGKPKYIAPNGNKYDSSWEYLYDKYLTENNIEHEYQSSVTLTWYDSENKEHVYIPDFKVGDTLIEIKGDHFFDTNGNFINPYNRTEKGYADALLKYKCMIDNNVQILTSKELKELNIL